MAVVMAVGGAGYIGSHVVRALKEDNRDVVVVDNLSKGHIEAIKGIPFEKADIKDQEAIKNIIKKYNVDSVIHFAASIEAGESMKTPYEYYENNFVGTLNLLNALKETGVNKLVFSSTAAVYGEPSEIPITENCAKKPINVYGRTKYFMEQAMADFDMAYGLKYCALRYFNACGAHPSGDIGEAHSPETHLIALIMKRLLGQLKEFKLYGDDYDTPDGTCIRDYIHVCDLAQAHILALDYLYKGGKSTAFNIGNGNGYSNLDILKTIEKVTGKKVEYTVSERRPGDPAILVASSKKIMDELGFKPKYDSLEEIIKTAWNWYQKNPNGYEKN